MDTLEEAENRSIMFYIICKILLSPIIWLFYPTRVIGKENLIKKGSMIIAVNHQSNRDVFILGVHIFRKIKFMAKKELFKNKIVGYVLKSWGAYPIRRGEADITAIKTTLRLLKNGEVLAIFPEGTRIENTSMKDIKNGVAMFSSKTESPVVPAFFEKKPKLFRRNRLLIGKSFYISEVFGTTNLTKEQLNQASEYILARILELLKKYRDERLQKKTNKNMRKSKIR